METKPISIAHAQTENLIRLSTTRVFMHCSTAAECTHAARCLYSPSLSVVYFVHKLVLRNTVATTGRIRETPLSKRRFRFESQVGSMYVRYTVLPLVRIEQKKRCRLDYGWCRLTYRFSRHVTPSVHGVNNEISIR